MVHRLFFIIRTELLQSETSTSHHKSEVYPMYYHKCPDCGANLDPGERCDCKDERKQKIQINAERGQNLWN